MSDKFNKTGLASGSSWSLFTKNTDEEDDTEFDIEKQQSFTTRLHVQDSNKFGLCPARECLQLAVCKQCQKLVLLSSIQRHYEIKHQTFLSTVKPSLPKKCIPPTTHNSVTPKSIPTVMHSKQTTLLDANSGKIFIRIEEVNPSELNVKIEEVPLTIPQFNPINNGKLSRISIKKLNNDSYRKHNNNNYNGSNKNNNVNTTCSNYNNIENNDSCCSEAITSSISSPQVTTQIKENFTKKIPNLKVKEYDVDRHCGVWIPELEQNCTRSLTCKTHSLSLRRQVPGRSKDFDVLLAEHRAKVAMKAQENSSGSSSQSHSVSNYHSPYGFDRIIFPTVKSTTAKSSVGSSMKPTLGSPPPSRSMSEDASQTNSDYSPNVYVDYILDEIIGSSNLPTTSVFPKPLKANSFGGRQTDCKCRVYSRRMDHFRNATSSMLDRYGSSSSTFPISNTIDSTKVRKDGLRLTVQDPLQNGILHKQKHKNAH